MATICRPPRRQTPRNECPVMHDTTPRRALVPLSVLVSLLAMGVSTTPIAAATPVALIRINEFNANILNGCDLIELRVVASGLVDGLQLWERTAPILTFPAMTLQVNDYIIVHLDGNDPLCNPSGIGNETSSPGQFPASAHPQNNDLAYDWYSSDVGLANTDNVLTIYGGAAGILDAVLASDDPVGTAATDSETQAATVAAAGQWTMVGGGVPAGGFVDDAFNAHAVQDLNGTANTASGISIQRTNDVDTQTKADWSGSVGASWGANNPGQAALPGCPEDFGRCGGACVDLDTDPEHCGACGSTCGAGRVCAGGVCACASDPECAGVAGLDVRCCGGACTDVVGNSLNCGGCDFVCGSGSLCCGVACHDPASDPAHCGGCGLSCAAGQACCGGACADTATDPLNCGACGVTCAAGESCCDGVCSALGTDPANCGFCGVACANLQACCSGGCRDLTGDPAHCGGCSAACAPGESCCAGGCADLESSEALCGACGTSCAAGQTCLAGSCRATAPPAAARINELNATISGGCDLVELRVIRGGSMDGFELWERTTPILRFSGLAVHANDRILVHLGRHDVVCNPPGILRETRAMNELPASTHGLNSDSAFDWYSEDLGLASTDNVLTLLDGAQQIVDVVLTSDDPVGTAAAESEAQAAVVAVAGHWEMVGGGVPPGGFVGDDFNAHAVQDLDATGLSSTGGSIARINDADTNTKLDWSGPVASSWGQDNAGQAAFPADDIDGDGFGTTDCDDWNPGVHPGALQICDGVNNDCSHPSYPGLADTNEIDDDTDGLSECQGDCNDTDPTALRIPAQASGLVMAPAPGGVQLAWDDLAPGAGPGTVYDIFSGLVSELRSSAGFSGGSCQAENLASPTYFLPDSVLPAVGDAFYFMVRGQNACPGGTGSYGTAHRDATSAASAMRCN